MVVRKKDESYARKHLLINALTMVPFIIGFMMVWKHVSTAGWDLVTWGYFACLTFYAVINFIWQQYRSNRFRCPCCKEEIVDPHQNLEEGDAIVFFCKTCDIEWETGMNQSSGTA